MAESEKGLFGEQAVESGERTLVLSKGGRKQLTKAQQVFNRLVKKIETLTVKLQKDTARLDALVEYFAKNVAPREERLREKRRQLVFSLEPYLEDKVLKKKQRDSLKEMIANQISLLVTAEGKMPEELKALFKKVTGEDFDKVTGREFDSMRASMDEMFKEFGMNVDLSGFRAGLSEEEMAREAARVMAQLKEETGRLDEEEREEQQNRTKKQSKREEQARQAEEARKTSISKIYRDLARVLHPDLEPDETAKPRKVELMAKLTAAYRANDLHTMLRLELEWIRHEDANLERMTDEKLAVYNKVLQEQVDDLKQQADELPFQPQYRTVTRPVGAFEIYILDGEEYVHELDEISMSIDQSLARFKAGDGLNEVREAVRMYRQNP